MIVVPSLDVERGRVVKRERGREGTGLRVLGEPGDWIARWADQGARRLHLVDLDGAGGQGSNRSLVLALSGARKLPIQVGGGVRSLRDIEEVLGAGADRVLLSTSVWRDPQWGAEAVRRFGDRVGFALDLVGGRLALEGWTARGPRLDGALRQSSRAGVRWLVYTDIAREGTRRGIELEPLRRVRGQFSGELLVAGGIATREELRLLAAEGVDGAIVGRSLYDGSMPHGIVAEVF
jgi:phosphoribosylformimino-5-aminoimidazole carboxamide ribotide isomerase